MSAGDDVLLRLPRSGAVGALAEAIALHTGAPGLSADRPALREALARAFPRLGEPASIEGCTTHPALTVRMRVPGLNREAAKVVLVPSGEELEVRLRGEVPGGSYRKETLLRIADFLSTIEEALKVSMKTSELYFSVDIEANGPIPGEFSMTALGACVVGRPGESFYAELKPLHDRFDPRALAVGGLTMDHLRAKGEEPAEAMRRFSQWVKTTAGQDQRPVLVAFNATFDWMYLHWYLVKFTGSDPFGVSGLDIKAYFMGMEGVSWGDTRKSDVCRRFPPGLPHTHNALDDAREQAAIFAQMLAARKAGVKSG